MTFIFTKGVLKAKSIQNADDFLVAGRNIGWFLLFSTMGATVIGGGSSIGAMGKTYEWGLLMLFVSTGWYFHFIFSGFVVAPKFREAKLYTVAGYFGMRFGEGARFVVLLLSLLFSVFIVAAQMAAFGTVLSTLIPSIGSAETILKMSIIIGGLIVVIYSTAGGLMAVIYTDVYQFLVLFIGFLVTLIYVIPDLAGSWGQIHQELPETFFQLEGGKGWIFMITTFLAFLLGETFAPGYATRYCIGKNAKHTKIGIAGVGFFLALTFPVILFFLALYARFHFPDIEPQQALPVLIKHLHNPVIGAIMIAALLSAVMSSADSALNSSTAIFVKDLFEHQLKWKDKEDVNILKLARICTVILGLVSICIAVLWTDIIEILLFTYHVWAPAIILPVVVGTLSKRSDARLNQSILLTMIISTLLTFGYRFTPYVESFDPAVFGVGISIISYFTISIYYRAFKPIS
jgi:solute:Na+ symporter, SSS family